ncbi:MAG: hypothetical protein KIS90_06065 [Phenylobacterium sp.]|nr:hypothetical protein [Phenylobacterium sp.]
MRLQLGDFGGWADYEARFGIRRFPETAGAQVTAALSGALTTSPSADALAGRRVLLLGEQGIGDQVMFAGMIPDLQAVAASVTCVCEPRLVRLFRAAFPGASFAGPAEAQVRRSGIDRVVAMGSLGSAFRRTRADFPGRPYLTPSDAARARWAERLGPRTTRLRVGVSWRGGLPNTRRDQRSLALEQLAPVLGLPDCEVVSLQYGDAAAEIAAANASLSRPIRAFAATDLNDFDDLAGLVSNLDLVVSVQTALVHLAGGLGRPCLTLVPFNAEWRYMAAGETMPWYGSVRLLRQAGPGAWGPVIEAAAAAVAARLET